MGEIINDQPETTVVEQGAAGAPEGSPAAEPSTSDVQKMYDDLGIKATAPSGKPKGRPKASDVRAKDSSKDGARSADTGSDGDDDDEGKRENARSTGKDGRTGNQDDEKGKKDKSDSGEVQDESEEAGDGVRKDKSRAEEDSERRSEEGTDDGDGGAGEEEGESESEAEKGKRPGKSNPAAERRIQQLTAVARAKDQEIDHLRQQLQESTAKQEQARIAQDDPEYTIDDFRTVQDADGNIHELDSVQAELAWRRWCDGYNQRAAERSAEENRRNAREQHQAEIERETMRASVEAYDSLASMMDDYPELVKGDKYDAAFAADAMPIIEKSIEYLAGTEPGNPEGNLPIIIGMKMNPREILGVLKRQNERKRSLPLNGVNDNVDSRSNVNVPHSRSSDSTVNAANDLYKQLGIKKRL